MAPKRKAEFDPAFFLSKAGIGRTILQFPKRAVIFAQGDIADAVFYVQKGKVKITIVSGQGNPAKERKPWLRL